MTRMNVTRTKKIVAACALTLGVFSAGAAPALALSSGGSSQAPSNDSAGADSRHSSGVGGLQAADLGIDNRHSS